MLIYLVIRETQYKIPDGWADYCQTETEGISAHRTADGARKMIETETFLNAGEGVRYYMDYIELKEDTDGK